MHISGAFRPKTAKPMPGTEGMVLGQRNVIRLLLVTVLTCLPVRQAVGAFEALLEEVTVYRESERLLADPAVERGDRAIAEGMVGRYEGLHFENKWAERLHQTGMKVRGGCYSIICNCITSATDVRPTRKPPAVQCSSSNVDHLAVAKAPDAMVR